MLAGCASSPFFPDTSDDATPAKQSAGDAPARAKITNPAREAICAAFFSNDTAQNGISSKDLTIPGIDTNVSGDTLINLGAKPADDLQKAVLLDLAGKADPARRLYLWLTAADPDSVFEMKCGNGVTLSGKVPRLAQQRLELLDQRHPELVQSSEINRKVSEAVVPPGPTLPTPPKVKRNTDFYKESGPINVPPEDSLNGEKKFKMDVSANTAALTSTDDTMPRAHAIAKPDPRPQQDISASAPRPSAPEKSQTTAARTPAPVPSTETDVGATPSATPKAHDMRDMAAPTPSSGTIAGQQNSSAATDPVLTSTSRPEENGTLEYHDPAPKFVEVPMTAAPSTPSKAASTTSSHTADPSGPYYAIQLAAYRTRDRAENAWREIVSRSDGIFNGVDHEVRSIAITGKGLFFRLMTGHFETRGDAKSTCDGFKRAGLDCLVRRVTP